MLEFQAKRGSLKGQEEEFKGLTTLSGGRRWFRNRSQFTYLELGLKGDSIGNWMALKRVNIHTGSRTDAYNYSANKYQLFGGRYIATLNFSFSPCYYIHSRKKVSGIVALSLVYQKYKVIPEVLET